MRIFLILMVAMLGIIAAMAAAGQISVSAAAVEIPPAIWPSSGQAFMQTTVPPQANLAISKKASPDPAIRGNPLTYTVTVTNNGLSNASGVFLADTLPSGITFGTAVPSQGSCNGTSLILCNLGSMVNGATATLTIVVTPTQVTTLTNTAQVAAVENDPDSSDNSTTITTTVVRDVPDPRPDLVFFPILFKASPTLLSVFNDNTGGNVTFEVVEISLSCIIANNDSQFCGSFAPGAYTVRVTSQCGPPTTFAKTYASGPVTTRVFCK